VDISLHGIETNINYQIVHRICLEGIHGLPSPKTNFDAFLLIYNIYFRSRKLDKYKRSNELNNFRVLKCEILPVFEVCCSLKWL
jgi:hypothetical protein